MVNHEKVVTSFHGHPASALRTLILRGPPCTEYENGTPGQRCMVLAGVLPHALVDKLAYQWPSLSIFLTSRLGLKRKRRDEVVDEDQ